MGIEKLIPQDLEPGDALAIKVYWREDIHKKTGYTERDRIIIDEAIEHGLVLPNPPPVLGVILLALVADDGEGTTTVSIGVMPPPFDSQTWCVAPRGLGGRLGYDFDPTIKLCHLIFKIQDNPLELHWRQRWTDEPVTSIEGLEKLDTITQATRYTKELCKLLPNIGRLFKSGRGRPEGVAPTEAEFKWMREEYIRLNNLGYSQEKIIEALNILDTKTLRKYTREWGIKSG